MVKSMNPDLLNPREVYIGRLKSKISSLENIISEFKKYDQKRKDYYKDLAVRVGELGSELAEYQDLEDPTGRLQAKIKAQRNTIRSLQAILNIKDEEFPEDMDLVSAKNEIKKLKGQVETLTKTNSHLRNSISELCYKLNKNEFNTTIS